MKRRWFWLILYTVAVALLAVIIYVAPSVAGLLDPSYIAKYGELTVTDEIDDAWIVRDETVYAANKSGSIERLSDDGALVSANDNVIKVKDGTSGISRHKYRKLADELGSSLKSTSGSAKTAGYVSYSADGHEGELTPSKLDDLTEDSLKKINGDESVDLPDSRCGKGTPVYRITQNGAWWMVFFVDSDAAKKYKEGASVTVTMDSSKIDAVVRSVDKEGKKDRVILRSKEYNKNYLTTRRTNLKVESESESGILIQERSIIKLKGKQGVLVKNKVGEIYFMPVKVKASDGETAAVYQDLYMDDSGSFVETIGNYDEIVRLPSKRDIREAKESM